MSFAQPASHLPDPIQSRESDGQTDAIQRHFSRVLAITQKQWDAERASEAQALLQARNERARLHAGGRPCSSLPRRYFLPVTLPMAARISAHKVARSCD